MTHKKKAALLASSGLALAFLPLFMTGETGTILGGVAFALAVLMEVMAVRTMIARFGD